MFYFASGRSFDVDLGDKKAASGANNADILLEIPLFWGHFELNILYFWLRMVVEELKMKNIGCRTNIWYTFFLVIRCRESRFRIL